MSDIRDNIKQQFEEARKLQLQLEADKARTKAELTRKLEQIDLLFAPRIQGAQDAARAFQAILNTFPNNDSILPLSQTLIRTQPLLEMRHAVKRAFEESNGAPLHLDDVTQRVHAIGVQSKAQNPSEAVRAAIYGLIDKGEPILRVAERTWAWQPKSPIEIAAEANRLTGSTN